MPSEAREPVVVVGGGPVGAVLALLLAGRGHPVDVYERRPDMRTGPVEAGRSINLVLCDRGLIALEPLGLREEVLALTVPVYGRLMHNLDGSTAYQPYGKDDSERNYSISRAELNARLLDRAEGAGVRLHFEHTLVSADLARGDLLFARPGGARVEVTGARRVFGCDGAPSAVREALVAQAGARASLEPLEHGYKELLFPAAPGGGFALDERALHIWPRGDHFLMGLPNRDGSFTGTVYLPLEGPHGFASLTSAAAVEAFFAEHYPDAVPLLPDLAAQLLANPLGHLGTVRCAPWQHDGRVLLVGDAAHAVVPFFGQGLNCGFEDFALLLRLLEALPTEEALATFSRERKPDADAIAAMALENFVEMRAKVADPAFLLRKQVEAVLQREMPERYRTRYAMVMYSSIPYAVAQQAGVIQRELLDELCAGLTSAEDVDRARAAALIDARLAPFLRERGVSLTF